MVQLQILLNWVTPILSALYDVIFSLNFVKIRPAILVLKYAAGRQERHELILYYFYTFC
jgi:hypothetical protein